MWLKELWAKIRSWLQAVDLVWGRNDYLPPIDDEGLIATAVKPTEKTTDERSGQNSQVVVKAIKPVDKTQSLEKLQEGFNKLVEQLQNINEHLNHQISQHDDLINRIDKLPELLTTFPAAVENQKQIITQLAEQLNAAALKQQQFVDAVEKTTAESTKQTNTLTEINHQLAAAADADVQMAESFNRFNDTLDKLNQTAASQTDSITQMDRTFAASDRHLKYIVSRQNKRLTWLFIIAISICAAVILILAGIIIYLRR